MQPAAAIPPYDRDSLLRLKGMRVRVPTKNGKGYWWMEIKATTFISENSAAVFVEGCAASGNARWVELSVVRFHNHCFDPLRLAIHKARSLNKTRGDQALPGVSSCAGPHA